MLCVVRNTKLSVAPRLVQLSYVDPTMPIDLRVRSRSFTFRFQVELTSGVGFGALELRYKCKNEIYPQTLAFRTTNATFVSTNSVTGTSLWNGVLNYVFAQGTHDCGYDGCACPCAYPCACPCACACACARARSLARALCVRCAASPRIA